MVKYSRVSYRIFCYGGGGGTDDGVGGKGMASGKGGECFCNFLSSIVLV